MIYTKDKLEDLADAVNRKYFPERLSSTIALDPYDLVDKLGCTVDWKYISPDDTILGATFFSDSVWPVWPNGTFKKGDMCTLDLFYTGTIVINQRVIDSKKKNAVQYENFIVGHECAHWIKDKDYFESHGEKDAFHICQKNDFESTWWRTSMSEIEIIERQTNYLNAAILMPRDIIPTISWSTPRSYEFCFDAVEQNATIAIGMIGCKRNKSEFLRGYNVMLEKLSPSKILCFGTPFEEMEGNIIPIDYQASRKVVR